MRDIYCAVTDIDWFEFLRSRRGLTEINFWKPSPRPFKAVEEGGIFAFKLKAPINKIGGFGVLTTSADSEIGTAWSSFGEGNGVPDLDTFVQKIRSIRKEKEVNSFSIIGVRVLVHPVFLKEDMWLDPPDDWSSNIVTGKTYSTNTSVGLNLLRKLEASSGGFPESIAPRNSFPGLSSAPQARYGSPIPVKPRIGQGTFRTLLAKAYDNRCALGSGLIANR